MKKINRFVLAILMIAITGITGCQKEYDEIEHQNDNTEAKQTPEVEVVDGILHFRDIQAFIDITDNLGEMTDVEKDEWEQKIGFKTLRKDIDEAYNLMENAKTLVEYNQIIEENKDIIHENDDEVMSNIPSILYQSVSNREGIFYVNNVIHKVDKNQIYTSKDGKISTIDAFTKGIADTYVMENINSITYFDKSITDKKSRTINNCYGTSATYTSSNHRKIYASIKAFKITIYNYQGRPKYQYVSVQRYSKSYKKSWGKYRLRKAHHHRKEIEYTVHCPVNQNGAGFVEYGYVNELFWGEQYGGYTKTYSQWKRAGVLIILISEYTNITTPYFRWELSGKFNTKGHNGVNHWMTLFCD